MDDSKQAAHPAQKPVQLMKMLLQAAPLSVCDPYMGTGSTGVACLEMGKKFIGVELDADYFKIAEKRISEATMQPLLLDVNAAMQARGEGEG